VIAALLLAVSAPVADPAAMVAALEDRQSIEELFNAYGRAVDAQDFAAVSRLFARDGEWSGAGGGAKGPAAIEAFLNRTLAPAVIGKWQGDFHLVAPMRIELAGDRATAQVRWIFSSPQAGRGQMTYAGRYDDRLVREDGRWRFARRLVTADIAPRPAASK
jgi:uncharacterized protein (TIGR02246 family)